AAAAGIGVGMAARRAAPAPAEAVRRMSIDLPANAPLALAGPSVTDGWPTAVALSPAGDRIAYIAPQGTGTALAVRAIDGDSVTIVPGTEGAYFPFYSPDGKWIGFFAGDLLRKVPASGGPPVTLAEVNRITGAAWEDDDRIYVFERAGFELHRIAASGSREDSAIRLDTQFGTPDLLPGGEWAVGQLSSGQLALLQLATGREMAVTRRGVLPFDSVQPPDLLFATSPHWMPSGWLVYAAGDGVLTALPFDARARKVLGQSVPLFTGVRMEAGFGYADFDIAGDGTLVFVPGRNQLYSIFAFVREGGRLDTLPFPRGQYVQPRISPDGTQLAAQLRDPAGRWDVLLMNLATGVRHSIPVEGNYRGFPASWLPSGKEIMIGLWDPVQFLNYGARIQSLETGKWWDLDLRNASYMTVAPNGKEFVFSDWKNNDLFLRALSNRDTVRTRIAAKGFAASFSPDGRWVAWGGVGGEVAVSPDPPTGAIYPVAERGVQPLWTPKGDAIIYRDGTKYWRVPVSTRGGFHAGKATLVANGPFLSAFAWNHAMMPDGRLLVLLGDPQTDAGSLGVVTGFPALVARAAKAGAR
ncbi:MAG TPA: hypothetical protein VMT93_05375, partial [Gemmatimonadaceae bacterium]|nr:hypothetical protein [Gemmatimonadaceae bacterium]